MLYPMLNQLGLKNELEYLYIVGELNLLSFIFGNNLNKVYIATSKILQMIATTPMPTYFDAQLYENIFKEWEAQLSTKFFGYNVNKKKCPILMIAIEKFVPMKDHRTFCFLWVAFVWINENMFLSAFRKMYHSERIFLDIIKTISSFQLFFILDNFEVS